MQLAKPDPVLEPYGGLGTDYLEGKANDDYLEGGAGLDVYNYNASRGLLGLSQAMTVTTQCLDIQQRGSGGRACSA